MKSSRLFPRVLRATRSRAIAGWLVAIAILALGARRISDVIMSGPDNEVATGATLTINGTLDATGAEGVVLPDFVVGPASATDNAIARFDAATGKLLQNSSVTIDDSGNVAVAATTAASSTTTGSLVNAGGFGQAGEAYFGANVNVVGAGSLLQLAPSGSNPELQFTKSAETVRAYFDGSNLVFNAANDGVQFYGQSVTFNPANSTVYFMKHSTNGDINLTLRPKTTAPAEYSGWITFESGDALRKWKLGKNNDDASGSDAGHNFEIQAWSDANTYIDTPLKITRASGGEVHLRRPTRIENTIYLGSSGTLGIYFGSGTPEGAIAAAVGSTYHRTDGGAGTSFYVKESGTGNTGWVAK